LLVRRGNSVHEKADEKARNSLEPIFTRRPVARRGKLKGLQGKGRAKNMAIYGEKRSRFAGGLLPRNLFGKRRKEIPKRGRLGEIIVH